MQLDAGILAYVYIASRECQVYTLKQLLLRSLQAASLLCSSSAGLLEREVVARNRMAYTSRRSFELRSLARYLRRVCFR